MKRLLCIVLVSLFAFSGYAKESDEELLEKYVNKSITYSEEPILPDGSSERDMLVESADYFRRRSSPYRLKKYSVEFKNMFLSAKVDKPIVITDVFSIYRKRDRMHHYNYFIPISYETKGKKELLGYMTYFNRYDKEKGTYSSGVGRSAIYGRGENSTEKHRYLITEKEAVEILEEALGMWIQAKPMAVYQGDWHIGIDDVFWFWYFHLEEGYAYQGRMIHSFYVVPFAKVNDIHSITTRELLGKGSCGALRVSLKDRIYIQKENDYNLHEVLEKAEKGEKFDFATEMIYGSEGIKFHFEPLIIETQ